MTRPGLRIEAWRLYLREMRIEAGVWLLCGMSSLVAWRVITKRNGKHFFWPFWVIMPWGLVLAGRALDAWLRRYRTVE